LSLRQSWHDNTPWQHHGTRAVWALTDIGTLTVDNIGAINAGTIGIQADATGIINIGTGTRIGTINAGSIGILAAQAVDATNNGNITINATSIRATDFGIRAIGWGRNTAISHTGAVTSTATTGIYATTTSGISR
jgi:hypothetical protein